VRIAYRLGQLWANLSAGPFTAPARAEVAEVLDATEQKLFDLFSRADQWHSYRVLRCLRDAGYNHPDLLTAALLHDIGKTKCPLSIWDRTVIVVGGALFPTQVKRWETGSLDSWRRPFVARAFHPEWGADMAAAAGTRPAVVELIRRHQDKVENIQDERDQLLAYLQWADDQN
jgi:hypothetical protein